MNSKIIQAIRMAGDVVDTACLAFIHKKRIRYFKKIDLRTLKGSPKKKQQIRNIIKHNEIMAFAYYTKMLMIRNQILIVQAQPMHGSGLAMAGERSREVIIKGSDLIKGNERRRLLPYGMETGAKKG